MKSDVSSIWYYLTQSDVTTFNCASYPTTTDKCNMATPPWWFTSEEVYLFIIFLSFSTSEAADLWKGALENISGGLLRCSGENSFDLVMAGDVLIYLGCLKKVMFEVHRVLKNGGRSFLRAISELKQDCWRNCILKIYGYTHKFYIYYEWCSVIKSSKGSPSLLESSCHTF